MKNRHIIKAVDKKDVKGVSSDEGEYALYYRNLLKGSAYLTPEQGSGNSCYITYRIDRISSYCKFKVGPLFKGRKCEPEGNGPDYEP